MQETASLFDKIVTDVLEKPCFGFVCGLNAVNHPVMSRFFGFAYKEDLSTFTGYTFARDFLKMRKHLTPGDKITFVVSSPLDFKTIQLKGTLQRIYDTPEEEMQIPSSCNQLQSEILQRWGISNETFANWSFQQSVAVVLNVDEIFDQTPKINTGQKIN